MYPVFSDDQKCSDLIFIFLPGMTISTGSLYLLKHASIEEVGVIFNPLSLNLPACIVFVTANIEISRGDG